jgi:hypothetical protein
MKKGYCGHDLVVHGCPERPPNVLAEALFSGSSSAGKAHRQGNLLSMDSVALLAVCMTNARHDRLQGD